MEEIFNYLQECGFVRNNNEFTKTENKIIGQFIVNGQQQNKTSQVTTKVEYIGDAELDDQPYTQWKIIVNGEDQGDIIVADLNDFCSWCSFK